MKMRNKSPIFINAFAYGGSNLVWHLFQSHPNVCSPIQETDVVFHEQFGKKGKMSGKIVSLLSGQPKLFNKANLSHRRNISKFTQNYIDKCLFNAKMKNIELKYNKYKYENVLYKHDEIKNSRLVSKNINGVIFLTDIFYDMYPDATFIALVRDGLALCEGYLRRGISSAAECGSVYKLITQKMIEDSNRFDSYYIIKFEDVITDPVQSLTEIYNYANLDINKLNKIRLKAKVHYNEKGERIKKYKKGEKVWLNFDELQNFIDPRINEYQIDKLSDEDKDEFMKIAKKAMDFFSYSHQKEKC